MSAYDAQDQVLSTRLRELVRLAGAGELQDVSAEPGGPFGQGLHLTGNIVCGQGGGPVARAQAGSGTGPEEPDLPEGPHAPETPHAPDAPDVPETPDVPPHEAPEAPDLPDLPGVPAAPEVDGPAEMPEIPDAPDVLRSPRIPPTPDIPPAPQVPDMPEVPDAPDIPESPGIYDEPEIPEPPQIDDPDLPELDRPVDLPAPPGDLPGLPGDHPAPDAPDVPRPPDLPEPPHPAPGGPDAVLEAVTVMHSNHTHDMQFPDGPGRSGQGRPESPLGPEHPDTSAHGGRPGGRQTEGAAAVPPPVPGGHGGQGGSGGGSRGTGGGGSGGDGPHGPLGGGEDGHSDDTEVEAALRRMLQQSVRGIEPSPEALTHLQHAVPARRAHRRRALVGATAAVVLAGVGFPGLVSAGLVPGLDGGPSINASDGHERAQSAGGAEGAGQTQGNNGSGGASGSGGKSSGTDGSASPSPTQGNGSEDGDQNDSIATSAPSCGRQQLGDGSATRESPDSEGKVYGSFRVVNTSSDACTVEGEGVVGASAQGRADIDRIDVLDHTAGDGATGLPDPALAKSELVLKPGQAYEVKWAWVPKECNPPGPPEPKAQEGNGPEGSQGGNNGNSGGPGDPATGGNEGDPAGPGNGPGGGGSTDPKSSVVLSHTPEVGDPAAVDTELDGACAGTLYRTGVLAAD